jgi:hypothetical protein
VIRGFIYPMAREPNTQTYHATMLVTRTEDWCVEADSPEEARALLEAGLGHRCSPGDVCYIELDEIDLP